jgi:hypothetical protein
MSEPWGEFLDHEWHTTGQVIERPKPWTTDPWRETIREPVEMIPLSLLWRIAQPARIQFCVTSDATRTDEIRADILEHGLKDPFVLVIDPFGVIVLQDGHHRLVGLSGIEHFDFVPTIVWRSDRIKAEGARSAAELLIEYITS